MALENNGALVLFSGGQDSTTCLAWAAQQFSHVETIGFAYGQRHSIELECRDIVRARLKEEFPTLGTRFHDDHLIDLGALGQVSDTALTRTRQIEMLENGLPSTFVPGRNILFLTFAACVAYRRGLKHIVAGMCETDYSGYPDCRDDAIKALQVALNLGMDTSFILHTPLMWVDKAETWQMAEQIGGRALVEIVLEHTHTCYQGNRTQRHVWGYGCGDCPACELRASGFTAYQRTLSKRAAQDLEMMTHQR